MKSVPTATAAMNSRPLTPPTYSLIAERRGDRDHPRMHDGVLVDVVKVEGVGHGGVDLRRVRRREPVAEAQYPALRSPAPFQHQISHLADPGFTGPAERDTEEVEHLVLGDADHLGGQVLVPDAVEIGDEQLSSVGMRVLGAGWCHTVFFLPDRSRANSTHYINSGLESGKCRLTD